MDLFKVVLVDDEYMILKGLEYIVDWKSLGYEIIHTTKSAKDAIRFFGEHEVDLLISDVTMPEMSGLEMIETIINQNTHQKFKTLILSGYKEFEFVKKSLHLGVKNYLVKPIDKAELEKNLLEIHAELEAAKNEAAQETVMKNNLLLNWLHDELNEDEFNSLFRYFPNSIEGPYTPIEFYGETDFLIELVTFFNAQPGMMVIDKYVATNKLTVIISQDTLGLKHLLSQIEAMLEHMDYHVIVGETIDDWESMYVSYQKILQYQKIETFYPELSLSRPLKIVSQLVEGETINYVGFNKALNIGNTTNLLAELDHIFKQLEQNQVNPEQAKSIALLLYTDIYRVYPNINQEDYHEQVATIRKSQTITEIQQVLSQILINNESKVKQKNRYSDIINQAIDYINQHYASELTLKLVSNELHINTVYFGQLFKKETDMSFNQFLNRIRIKLAMQQLSETSATINEIAEQVGYNNTNYFSKMFKKLNGLSPKEYRDSLG
ncbi:response regulator transcription factor [Vagococcus zengguangii]|uniref:Response regulator transcription factor n=1 Tax=Vagococcus zengguangii TaxID=2571750 RepID=A0A4D7CQ41_9ENTE|nr:response regulator transcription factor [Vagococcus zengguangii]QCI86208.1 response regulator transcription factor [Vagococcus zengguangii]